MMINNHRFNIQPSKTSNVMIGTGSRSGSSDTTDELTASDPATTDDFDYASNNNNNNNNMESNSILNGRTSPTTMQSSSLFGDDAFDKITMDFDSIMANNDLDLSNRLNDLDMSNRLKSSDNSVNSEMILDKLSAELGDGPSDLKDSPGVEKGGYIGDELDMDLLDVLINNPSDDNKGAAVPNHPGSDSSIDQLFKENNSDSSLDKLFNLPLIDMDSSSNLPPAANTVSDNNNNVSNNNKNGSNTANINLSLKKEESNGSLCDSMGSLPSIGKISPTASFANMNNNTGMQASILQQMQQQQQQQQSMMMQRQQQLFLQQQMQQLQQQQRNNSQNNNNNNNNNNNSSSGNASSIQSIVNDQLSQLPQGNQLTKLGQAGLEQEKMKLIQRLQQIENSGMPMNVNQQQQQQQQQQFLLQKQMFLQQQKLLQQQQQQGIATAQSMPSLRTGGQLLQGQMQIQGQQNSFAMNQQMMQQQQQQQRGIGQDIMSQPMSANMNNNNNNSNSNSMFSNTTESNNNDSNNNNNSKKNNNNNNVSSIMGMNKGKDTPLLSFLRNKRSGGNSSNMMSMTGKQQQQLAGDSSLVGASNHSSNGTTSSGGILDVAPIDFSSSSTNPFLRKQMMNNLDKSVNRMNSSRGRLGGMAGGRGLSSSIRRNMMKQMASPGQLLSKSSHEPRRTKSSDSYESAGIIARVSSADHISSRRTGLTAGAAKAQNRRFTLSRSHNSFGNLTKTKSRGLTKSGGGSSSLSGAGSSTTSLRSSDSASSLIPIKRRGSGMSGGRGGHGAKHKLGSGGGSARRISSVPYMGTSLAESAAMIQQQMMEENQQHGPRHNDGWP